MAGWWPLLDIPSSFQNSAVALLSTVFLALIQRSETYTFCRNSYSYTYYSCSDYEYCCQSNKCCSNSALTLSIYQLWYFWFCIVLFFILCSGGIFGWYRKRYLRRHTVVTNVTSTGTTVVASNNQAITTLRPGQPMYPATIMAPPSYTMATGYPASSAAGPALPAYPPPAYNDPAYPPSPKCNARFSMPQSHAHPYPQPSQRMSGGQQMHSLAPPILPPIQHRQDIYQPMGSEPHSQVQNLPPPTL